MSHPIVNVAPKLVEVFDATSKKRLYRWKVRVTFADGSHWDTEDEKLLDDMAVSARGWLHERETGANWVPRQEPGESPPSQARFRDRPLARQSSRQEIFDQGKADGEADKPPADTRRPYLEGYEEGRAGKPYVRHPRDEEE